MSHQMRKLYPQSHQTNYFTQILPQSLQSRVDIDDLRRDENHLEHGHSFYITGETGVELEVY